MARRRPQDDRHRERPHAQGRPHRRPGRHRRPRRARRPRRGALGQRHATSRCSVDGDTLEIDHPQLSWDNWHRRLQVVPRHAPAPTSASWCRATSRSSSASSARSALISGVTEDASTSAPSAATSSSTASTGDLAAQLVSGEIAVRNHYGKIGAHTVSGDITATGEMHSLRRRQRQRRVSSSTSTGTPDEVRVNTVSGAVTTRLDAGRPRAVHDQHGQRQAAARRLRDHRRARQLHRQVRRRSTAAGLDFRVNTVGGNVSVLHAVPASMTPPVFAHGHLRLYLLSLLAERPHARLRAHPGARATGSAAPTCRAPAPSTRGSRSSRRRDSSPRSRRRPQDRLRDHGRRPRRARRPRRPSSTASRTSVTDSVRRLADEVRSSVNDAMKTLRADLAAAAARRARGPGRRTAPRRAARAGTTRGCRPAVAARGRGGDQRVPRRAAHRAALAGGEGIRRPRHRRPAHARASTRCAARSASLRR